jgi:hypothetical protein
MLRLNPNSKKSPPGGHHYIEYGITFRGDTFKQVAEKLKDFRLHNNIPLGNPEQEILGFYAFSWPYLVKDASEVVEDEAPDQFKEWRKWVQETWKNPPKKIVTLKEASDRWAVCENCPFNQQFKHDETDESAEIARRAFLLRRGMSVPDFLGFCSCHGTDLSAFVFFQPAKGFSSNKEVQPEGCWVS